MCSLGCLYKREDLKTVSVIVDIGIRKWIQWRIIQRCKDKILFWMKNKKFANGPYSRFTLFCKVVCFVAFWQRCVLLLRQLHLVTNRVELCRWWNFVDIYDLLFKSNFFHQSLKKFDAKCHHHWKMISLFLLPLYQKYWLLWEYILTKDSEILSKKWARSVAYGKRQWRQNSVSSVCVWPW